jgi:hypothetical protein
MDFAFAPPTFRCTVLLTLASDVLMPQALLTLPHPRALCRLPAMAQLG